MNVRALGSSGLHEFEPGRRIEEQIADQHHGTDFSAAFHHILQLTAADFQSRAKGIAGLTADQAEFGNRGDAGQRFAAKSH